MSDMRIDPSVFRDRRKAIVEWLSRERGLDGLLAEKPSDIRYLTGFSCSKGALFLVGQRCYLLVDGRYAEQAEKELQDIEVIRVQKNFRHAFSLLSRDLDGARIAYDRLYTTVATMDELRAALRKKVSWVGVDDPVCRQRMIKIPQEIRAIKKAVRIAQDAFRHVIEDIVSRRPSEKKVATMLMSSMVQLGSEGFPFPVIVASGRRSSMVHTEPDDKRIAGLLLMDWGAVVDGYCSDITRTLAVGKVSTRLKNVHALVMEARQAALEEIRIGKPVGALDEAARRVMSEAGYAEYFTHGLGHGVGMEVHECPVVGPGREEPLAPGMVFTVEPGIYLPGVGGVRVEDMVLVKENGYELLTTIPRDLDPEVYIPG